MLNKKKSDETLAELVRNARKEKGLSARKLANLLNLSHTEINNIESGYRVKPSIIVLKGLEQFITNPLYFNKTNPNGLNKYALNQLNSYIKLINDYGNA